MGSEEEGTPGTAGGFSTRDRERLTKALGEKASRAIPMLEQVALRYVDRVRVDAMEAKAPGAASVTRTLTRLRDLLRTIQNQEPSLDSYVREECRRQEFFGRELELTADDDLRSKRLKQRRVRSARPDLWDRYRAWMRTVADLEVETSTVLEDPNGWARRPRGPRLDVRVWELWCGISDVLVEVGVALTDTVKGPHTDDGPLAVCVNVVGQAATGLRFDSREVCRTLVRRLRPAFLGRPSDPKPAQHRVLSEAQQEVRQREWEGLSPAERRARVESLLKRGRPLGPRRPRRRQRG